MIRGSPGRSIGLAILTAFASLASLGRAADEPIDVGLEEQVDVQLVLVDFLVVDRDERTVPDVKIEDIVLKVDGDHMPVASLDVDCAAATEGVPSPAEPAPAPETPAEPRRIVLVLDHDHMTNAVDAYDRVISMLDEMPAEGDEHMLVSLGEVLRIEAPFTKNLDELRWALRRMRNDRHLYAGNHDRLTERRLFERLQALFDILERWPGRKTVVLFAGPVPPDGYMHDPQFKALAARSAIARTALYPVDTAGLQWDGKLGGPELLRRLANETGGRMTPETNDVAMAYARAQSDMSCTYTLGFRPPKTRWDKERQISIRVWRKGLRVVQPEYYVHRSVKERSRSLLETATVAPHYFESGELRAGYFVLGVAQGNWRVLFGVKPDPAAVVASAGGGGDGAGAGEQELRGIVRRPRGTVVKTFEHDVAPAADGSRDGRALYEVVELPPGEYAFSAVLGDPLGGTPRSVTRLVQLPAVPTEGAFVLGPYLGRTADTGARDKAAEFEALLEPVAVGGPPLDALTIVCAAGAAAPRLALWISTLDGRELHRFEEQAVALSGGGNIRCGRAQLALPSEVLRPGSYAFHAAASSATWTTEPRSTPFAVFGGGAAPAAAAE